MAFSPNERFKAVHDLNTDAYNLYDNTNSDLPVVCLSPAGNSRKPKGSAFGEDGSIVVCGGDEGLLYVYDVVQGDEIQRLEHPGMSVDLLVPTSTDRLRREHCVRVGGTVVWFLPTSFC